MNFIYLDILQTDKWLFPLIFPEIPEDDDETGIDEGEEKIKKTPKRLKDIQEIPIN